MQVSRKKVIALSTIAAFLAVPAVSVLADSQWPFGHGNPMDYISGVLNNLEQRVSALEAPAQPSFLSGVYYSVTTGTCLYADPTFGPNWQAPSNNFTQNYTDVNTSRYMPNGTIQSLTYNVFVLLPSSAAFVTSHNASPHYTISPAHDGTFTWRRDGQTINGVTYGGTVSQQGRIFDGGKMLMMASMAPELETITRRDGTTLERTCTRTTIARKISD